MTIEGVEERARRILTSEAKQPDGSLFELIVALAYRRDGWPIVRFIDEEPGRRTPDFQMQRDEECWSVECKRIDRSDYSLKERDRFWRLWDLAARLMVRSKTGLFVDLNFRKPLFNVPDRYLEALTHEALTQNKGRLIVDDEWAEGTISPTNLQPLLAVLENDVVLHPSQRMFELLTGAYDRFATHAGVLEAKFWSNNGRYLEDVSFAAVARWRCTAPEAVNIKARHFLRQLVKANRQLEAFGPSIIHLGLEAMEGGDVEAVRRPKILEMVSKFDAKPTDLRWLNMHYFVHESPPDMSWAVEETMEWFAFKNPPGQPPRPMPWVLVPPDAEDAPHPWVKAD